MKRNSARLALLFLALGLLLVPEAFGQTTSSILEGTVTDSSGGAVPQVSVEVKGGTVLRTVVTDSTGFYRAVALRASTYTVTASRAGFKTKVLEGIVLVLDRTARLDIVMEVAPQRESVTVTASVPLIDSSNTSTRQVIEARTIDAIPLNGRNYLDLIRLTPGVAVNTNARSDLTDRDTNGAILGERAGNTGFLIDGVENNDDFHGGVFQAFTQDAIQEFEVISAGYKAEFGRGSGGIVNVISKTGTNEIHGNGFFFVRNDALDTSNVSGREPPELSRYDYGMTLGAPIRKDKAWVFGSVEKVHEKRGAIFPPNIPDILAKGEDFSRKPENDSTRVFGKYTQRLNSKNDLQASVSWTRAEANNKLATPNSLPSSSNNNLFNTELGTIALTTIFNPRLVLDSSFGVRTQDFSQNQNQTGSGSFSVIFLDNGRSFDFGPPLGSVQTLEQRYYTVREALSFFAGHHSLKLGGEYTRTHADGVNGQGLEDVIVTITPFFNQFGTASFQIPQGVAFLNPGDNLTRLRNNGWSFFVQDDWRVHPTVLVSMGARYDYDSKFSAVRNVAPRMGLAWSPDKKTVIQASWGIFYDRYRLGIAQAVPELGGFNGRTVVELDYPRLANDVIIPFPGSLGLFATIANDPFFLNKQFNIPNGTLVAASNIQSLTGMTPAQFAAAVNQFLSGFEIPFVPLDFSPSTGFLRQEITGSFQDQIRISRPFHTPYNTTLTLGFQREVVPNLSVGLTYVHRNFHNILGVRITNLAFESRTAGFPITTDGGPLLRTYGPWYKGKYDALIVAVNKRFSQRFLLQGNYTYAKSTDNLLNSNLGLGIAAQGGGAVPTDNLNINFDRGNSDLSLSHSMVVSGLVDLPVGFHISGVLRATSGVHFTAANNRAKDYDGDGISSLRPPNTQRNQFTGPPSANLDLRIEKSFKFAERYTASVLAEFFNLTNAANPKLVNNFAPGGVPGPDFGKTLVPLPGREVQFGLRFKF